MSSDEANPNPMSPDRHTKFTYRIVSVKALKSKTNVHREGTNVLSSYEGAEIWLKIMKFSFLELITQADAQRSVPRNFEFHSDL
ncbi:MAG TPA: hypothetical protein VFT90_15755, partial [Chryseosolibacter sp.]|nr:hypothetical protein [Chryseosolibacter sp.]